MPREADNLTIEPVTRPLVGARASMLGTLHFDGVKIKETDLIGGVGFGKIAVGAYALDIGRYIIAWGRCHSPEHVWSDALSAREIPRDLARVSSVINWLPR